MNNLGEVEIELNGEKHILRCSLRAARTVNSLSGGFSAAFAGLAGFNFSTYAAVVAAGLDKRNGDDLNKVEEAVYTNGMESLTASLTKYLSLLMNGGREPSREEAPAGGKG